MNILTINAGSSSIKYKIFKDQNSDPCPIVSGLIEGIGEKSGQWQHQSKDKLSNTHTFASHEEAFSALAQVLNASLEGLKVDAVGHRVVHGGQDYYKPTVIDKQVLQAIIDLKPLAPLHNPINALGIQFAMHYFPEAKHIALFDSGFHHTMPEAAYTYAIEKETAIAHHIRRYGFHGLNHEYVAHQAALFLNKPLSTCHFISLHLGNGASACLIKAGKSMDTSMGMTPLAGFIMGSRCGDIDPAIPLYLQRQGLSVDEVDILLNKRSGLTGIAQDNDMRHLLSRLENDDKAARLAIEMYVYAIQKMIGAYVSQTPSLDGLIFTGGVGENAARIRAMILAGLEHLNFMIDPNSNETPAIDSCKNIAKKSHTPVLVVRGDEEYFMAVEVLKLRV